MLKDKMQKVISYISATGLTVYEREQYNAKTNDWYIVGDSTTNKIYINSAVALHNYSLNQ